jgi:hypothetical protein
MQPELLSDSVHEKLDPPTARAHVDVELLAVHEDLTKLAQYAPVRALVELQPASFERLYDVDRL